MLIYQILADLVVVVHFTFVAVVIFGLLAVLIGAVLRWRWIRSFWFRLVHFLMILVVVVQALLGIVCPLTTLENHLRRLGGSQPYPGSFIGHWVDAVLFYQAPPWVFTLCYCLFGVVVLATLILVPPRWPSARPTPRRTTR